MVLIERGRRFGLTTSLRCAGAGKDGWDDVLAQDVQGGDGTHSGWRDLIVAERPILMISCLPRSFLRS